MVAFGRSLAVTPHAVPDEIYEPLAAKLSQEQIVALTAFGALMVATNVFNNALGVPLDEYLEPFRQGRGAAWVSSAERSRSSPERRTGRGGRPRWRSRRRVRPSSRFDVARPLSYPGYAMGTADDLESLAAACREAGGDVRRSPGTSGTRPRSRGRGHRARAVRPDRHPLQQRRHLRLRPGPRADRGGVGRDARHQPEGGLAGGAAGDSGDDPPEIRRHHQQLVGGGAARHGAAEPLRRLEVGADRAHQVVGDRAGARTASGSTRSTRPASTRR